MNHVLSVNFVITFFEQVLKSSFSDIKRLLKDPEYIRHHQEVIKADEKVIKRV